jgi:hypothetical protein
VDGATMNVWGHVAPIVIGKRAKLFVLCRRRKVPVAVFHYASGRKMHDSPDLVAEVFLATKKRKPSMREITEACIAEIVAEHGPDAVLASLDEAPIINTAEPKSKL